MSRTVPIQPITLATNAVPWRLHGAGTACAQRASDASNQVVPLQPASKVQSVVSRRSSVVSKLEYSQSRVGSGAGCRDSGPGGWAQQGNLYDV
jgi:hypothetical protein